MTDHSRLLEATLDSLPEGIALVGMEDEIVFWNQAAAAMTGYDAAELLGQPVPEALLPLFAAAHQENARPGGGTLTRPRHKLGHDLPAIARQRVLRDELGEPIGAAILFHPAQSLDALPHGEIDQDSAAAASQAELEERLSTEFEDFLRGDEPLGVLWIAVDQAHDLRKTHGASACQTMLAKVQCALAQGLRPAEELGRWGEDEFLVIAHERSPQMLAAQARMLVGLARTTDFRWWGDRISVTVSIGAAQAERGSTATLGHLLERARDAMEASVHAGGNRITSAPAAAAQDCGGGMAQDGLLEPQDTAGRQSCWRS